MASRIISVTFETSTQARAGAFSVPQAAATLLGIGSDDTVELRITWEGGKLELSTSLRSGLDVYPRSSDESTAGLTAIPPRTPITVTVWRPGEGASVADESRDWTEWTDERFAAAFEAAGGSLELLERLRNWAKEHDVALRYGAGRTEGPLHFDVVAGRDQITLISLGAGGGIEWVFRNNLDRAPGLADRPSRVDLVRRVRELFAVDRPDERADTWLNAPASNLDAAAHARFLAVLTDQLSATRRPSSELGTRYQRLFQNVLERFKALRPGVTSRARVGPENWLDFSAGRSGFLFTWSTAQNKYFRIELYIDVGDQSRNKQLFDQLRRRSDELEGALGMPLSWERLDAKRASRLAVYHDVPGDNFDTDGELVEWAAQTMARFVDVMTPVVKAL
jgi:hypothetical protein